ncbi:MULTISPECIES: response regulator transcription factor [unclassified Clostridioides]|uniref:response regulator transcription factor n=1 Tax=unclassified Clostridioides TaxID=2635829 RepID=UPI001D125230|nr:response regulator transcription factor [Clostridioides sp. ZZV14-6150]MCC0668381.1 response regulator transcription factor [Clostridioides sp. ZZV14-6153]MCC0719634.1 response regulator transcription factor [Clostridioides sp. ZZV14-6105]MCC0722205.1 response regulator transcription factor [Clostridioides sp. ZZV14-6104]MCC0725046.1 response regulator transcription factor [Clostridioides sp. ZZV14-6045]MCC0732070.1 response regulator transcription factor [Clostridioides sp. ZZV14-6048]MCC
MSKRILVIEDDIDIQNIIKTFLENAGYIIITANDGLDGIEKFKRQQFDLILLDILMPKIDGFVVCEMIRNESNIPIIILTALDEETDQVKGFELKVDDYITKPFSTIVLLKRVEAVLRRIGDKEENHEDREFLLYRDINIDVEGYKVFVNGKKIELTAREFEVLKELIEHKGRVLTRENLINSLWKYDFLGDERVVDTHIKNLRKKLDVDYIETIRGVGYRIDVLD